MTTTVLDAFLGEIGEIVQRLGDPALTAEAVGEAVRKLLAGPFFLPQSYLDGQADGPARHELHRDAASRFVVVVGVWRPGQSVPIHDHDTWGVVAGLENRAIQTTYRRVDDRATPGYASVEEESRVLLTQVSLGFVRPPDEAIHRIENPFQETAVTLHVFGQGGSAGHRYDLRDKSIVEVETPADEASL